MPLFLTVLEGASPNDAETIFATSDKRIIQVVAAEISRRFSVKKTAKRSITALHPVHSTELFGKPERP